MGSWFRFLLLKWCKWRNQRWFISFPAQYCLSFSIPAMMAFSVSCGMEASAARICLQWKRKQNKSKRRDIKKIGVEVEICNRKNGFKNLKNSTAVFRVIEELHLLFWKRRSKIPKDSVQFLIKGLTIEGLYKSITKKFPLQNL